MSQSINITRRTRRRKLKDGSTTEQIRYVVNFNDPETRKRAQKFFEKRRDAEAFKQNLIVDIRSGEYFAQREDVTVADVVELWLSAREGKIRPNSMRHHLSVRPLILGPLLRHATPRQRSDHTRSGIMPEGAKLIPLLADIKIQDLSTSEIRRWYNLIEKEVGAHSAKRAKLMLRSALELGAEDYNYRPPAMPKIIKARSKPKKTLLKPDDIAQLLDHADGDPVRGMYYAFPFLSGTRPSEQLPLRWEDVDFDQNIIRIHRSQDQTGQIYATTKTDAGTRDLPMSPRLRSMLLQHRLNCTRKDGKLDLVFPGLGKVQPWPRPRMGGGGQLLYPNWLTRFWKPGLTAAGVPYVTPHSARHAFVSNLQAEGVEVGLVAKIVGHANAQVTLGHYTQAVRGGADAVAKLDAAYRIGGAGA
ncbi:site-specific integrase [Algimonas arctica]|uniref:Site-specific integrase n=1 Tax=Algimonas arctica TaxID=1479486 RepID=A0A8J3CTE9_9PROT|nr:site-specific integrase [Algimonas arctica]GHB04722.1 site-specific integrase [Algimonas arctica]